MAFRSITKVRAESDSWGKQVILNYLRKRNKEIERKKREKGGENNGRKLGLARNQRGHRG